MEPDARLVPSMSMVIDGHLAVRSAQKSCIEDALAELRAGRMVIVVDAEGRENEGDLVVPAETVTASDINFMAARARGLICVAMEGDFLDRLRIPPMVDQNTDPHSTAFHVSVDAFRHVSTGISAADRAQTIRQLVDPRSKAEDFRRPGHVFPLAAREGGVLTRQGHTEASVDLVRLAGLAPSAVICEILKPDGDMARLPDLMEFARRHGLLVVTVADLISYRIRREKLVTQIGEAALPLPAGAFKALGFRDKRDGREHIALVLGNVREGGPPYVRVHSECLTGDVLGSRRCDCGRQLDLSLDMIARQGRGVLVYLRGHEGRGIGLLDKLRAYELQDQGLDTVEANRALGFPDDLRDYSVAAQILRDIGVGSVELLTNNPEKSRGLQRYGIRVCQLIPVIGESDAESLAYLTTKRTQMGHLLPETPYGLVAGL